jgi:hypothetical protein
MSKPRYRKIHAAGDKIEPRMARAVVLAADRVRERLPMRELERAIVRKDLRAFDDVLNAIDFPDAYLPSAEILKETVVRGGKVADTETD